MPEPPRIRVSVVHAGTDAVFTATLDLPEGAVVADAIARSGIRERHPALEIRDERVGVFARKVSLQAVLHDGDRVEVYRPLRIDPKEARRARAKSRSVGG